MAWREKGLLTDRRDVKRERSNYCECRKGTDAGARKFSASPPFTVSCLLADAHILEGKNTA
jgi:hypothetical protein